MTDAATVGVRKPSPLIRVLSQIRWPVLTGFDIDDVVKGLAKTLSGEYPRYNQVNETQLIVSPEGVRPQRGETLHRFQSADAAWSATLAPTFVSLESSAYTSHHDFVPRLGDLVEALTKVHAIPVWERFGYRYTNRISDERDIAELDRLFAPAVLGLVPLRRDNLQQSITEAVFEDASSSLLVRSIYAPPGAAIESNIPPLPIRAWFLDLDAFSGASNAEMTRARAEEEANSLSARAHEFFAMVSTDEYRDRYV